MDPDWDYILRGVYLGFKVINEECDIRYNIGNYGSITKGKVGVVILGRLQLKIDEQIITVVDKSCLCIHAMGGVQMGHDDFRAIIDCSSPDHTCWCRTNFSYNSVESVMELLREGDYMAMVDISNTYRAISIYPTCRERQGLAWDFGAGPVFLRDNRLCIGLSSTSMSFLK